MGEQIEQGNGKVAFWLITVTLLVSAILIVRQFIPAILWAIVLSVLLFPWYKKTQKKLARFKNCDTLASLYVTLFTIFIIVVPLLGFLVVGSVQAYNYTSTLVADTGDGKISLHNLATEVDTNIGPVLAGIGVTDFSLAEYVDKNQSEIVKNIYKPVTDGAKRLVMMIVTLIIAFLSTFFMIRDGHRLTDPVTELIPLPRDRTIDILNRMAATIRAVFYSVVMVALVQGLLCLVLYLVLGVPNPIAWWGITTLCAMIPLVGAPVGYVPAALVLFVKGHQTNAIILVLVGFLLVSQIDNFLRPLFIKFGTNLHMMAIFFALLGGIFTLGPIGLMVGPMILTLVLGMFEVLRERRKLAEENAATQ